MCNVGDADPTELGRIAQTPYPRRVDGDVLGTDARLPFCFTIWGTPAGPDYQPQGEST
jgi:hypothetical protein